MALLIYCEKVLVLNGKSNTDVKGKKGHGLAHVKNTLFGKHVCFPTSAAGLPMLLLRLILSRHHAHICTADDSRCQLAANHAKHINS